MSNFKNWSGTFSQTRDRVPYYNQMSHLVECKLIFYEFKLIASDNIVRLI